MIAMLKWSKFLPIFVIIIISLTIYSNILQNEFVYDDNTIIGGIKSFKDLNKLFIKEYFYTSGELSYRPLATFTYFLDYSIYEFSPWGYHLTNLILHTANGILLYKLLLRFSLNGLLNVSSFALFSAVLFISHPVLTEAVNVVSYREDLLVFLFIFLSFNLYSICNTQLYSFKKYGAYLLSCVFYLLALLSKEMAITFPLLLLLWDVHLMNRVTSKTGITQVLGQVKQVSGFIALSVAYLFVRFYYFVNPIVEKKKLWTWSISESFLTLPSIIINYIKLIILPVSLSAEYSIRPISTPLDNDFVLPCTILLSGGYLIYNLSKQLCHSVSRLISFGIAFFFIALLPVSNFMSITNPMAERYLYLPIAGLCIIGGVVASQLKKYSLTVLISLFTALIVNYSVLTINRNLIWKTNYTLWFDTVKKSPNSSRAHYNLGNAYQGKLLIDEAIQEYLASIRLDPNLPDSHAELGSCYLAKGLFDKAISEYKKVLRIDPEDRFIAYNLGSIYFDQRMYIESLSVYMKILDVSPNDRNAREMQGEILKILSRTKNTT